MPELSDKNLWRQIVDQVADEWRALPVDEQDWITAHLLRLTRLQEELHRLFLAADGANLCRDCAGGCCGHGRFHPNLANLVAGLVTGSPFFEPDFEQDCPYLGKEGCCFPPGVRPYNCISFLCETIESNLSARDRAEFYRREKEIRRAYELFEERYVGAGMRGVLIRGERLPAYLARR